MLKVDLVTTEYKVRKVALDLMDLKEVPETKVTPVTTEHKVTGELQEPKENPEV